MIINAIAILIFMIALPNSENNQTILQDIGNYSNIPTINVRIITKKSRRIFKSR